MMHSLAQTNVGEILPEIHFGPITRTMLALYAGASGDHNPAHIDLDFAKAAGLPDVFAHGMLSFGGLAQVVTRWCGRDRMRSFGARFLAIVEVHELLTCTGLVTERFEEAGETLVRVTVAATTRSASPALTGEALICVS